MAGWAGVRRRLRLPVLGLRARVTVTFALGAFVVSGILAVVIFITSRGLIIDQQLNLLRSQAYANAEAINSGLQQPAFDLFNLVSLAQSQPDSLDSVLYYKNGWYSTGFVGERPGPQAAEGQIPASLISMVLSGQPAEQTYLDGGTPRFAIGVPINPVGAVYFEEFDLSAVQATLHRLLLALITAAIGSTLAGAVYGRWSAGRSLRPLRKVAEAARLIAGGELGTRLETADVAELAVLANSFNRMVDRLQERIEREARFNSDVSHELRSPLTTLAASFAVLEGRSPELPERAQRAVALASAELRRFQRMVGDLLEISRLDAGSMDLSLDEVRMGELVRRTAETAVRDLRAHGLMNGKHPADSALAGGDGAAGDTAVGLGFPLWISPDAEGARVLVDKRRFERIVANLVENAALYGDGVTRMSVDRGPSSVRLAVEDRGPGVPPEERDRIFERFSRGTTAGRRGAGEGTGLGLALVAEHARLHGGRVWVEAVEDHGARFVVELPLAPSVPDTTGEVPA
jgi:two-component system, OmpR family, sensor histidine kinase MtrB